jgi:ethanolamine utilization protein EutQ
MSGFKHFQHADMNFKKSSVDGASTMICRAIASDISATMGGGTETLEKVSIEWTVTYDEILFIKEGRMKIRTGGKEHVCEEGDIVWLPNGTTLTYDAADSKCTYFYALYPVDWAARQGTAEP